MARPDRAPERRDAGAHRNHRRGWRSRGGGVRADPEPRRGLPGRDSDRRRGSVLAASDPRALAPGALAAGRWEGGTGGRGGRRGPDRRGRAGRPSEPPGVAEPEPDARPGYVCLLKVRDGAGAKDTRLDPQALSELQGHPLPQGETLEVTLTPFFDAQEDLSRACSGTCCRYQPQSGSAAAGGDPPGTVVGVPRGARLERPAPPTGRSPTRR